MTGLTQEEWLALQEKIRGLVEEDNFSFVRGMAKKATATLGTHTHIMVAIIPVDSKTNKSQMICMADSFQGADQGYLEILHAITSKLIGMGVDSYEAEVPKGPMQ